MEDNDQQLSFQLLTHKMAMVIALTNADWCFALIALDLTYQTIPREWGEICHSWIGKNTTHWLTY